MQPLPYSAVQSVDHGSTGASRGAGVQQTDVAAVGESEQGERGVPIPGVFS